MELLDFTDFEAFNELRRKMGTDQLGYFELFDPQFHLTGSERSELDSPGRLLAVGAIRVLADHTLALKNSRVLAYVPDENWYRSRREYPTYHVAMCEALDTLRQQQPALELLLTTRLAEDYRLLKIRPGGEVSVVEHGFVVCSDCLHTLRYRGYEKYRNRRRGHSQKVLSEFRLQDFYSAYPQYPLSFGRRPPLESEAQ